MDVKPPDSAMVLGVVTQDRPDAGVVLPPADDHSNVWLDLVPCRPGRHDCISIGENGICLHSNSYMVSVKSSGSCCLAG